MPLFNSQSLLTAAAALLGTPFFALAKLHATTPPLVGKHTNRPLSTQMKYAVCFCKQSQSRFEELLLQSRFCCAQPPRQGIVSAPRIACSAVGMVWWRHTQVLNKVVEVLGGGRWDPAEAGYRCRQAARLAVCLFCTVRGYLQALPCQCGSLAVALQAGEI